MPLSSGSRGKLFATAILTKNLDPKYKDLSRLDLKFNENAVPKLCAKYNMKSYVMELKWKGVQHHLVIHGEMQTENYKERMLSKI